MILAPNPRYRTRRERAGVPRARPVREDRGPDDEADEHAAGPLAGLLARRGRPLHGHRRGPGGGVPLHHEGDPVGVVSDGSAVLGLSDIGAQASEPVMEGKGALFRRFADIDVFDVELDATDPDADVLAEMTRHTAGLARRFNVEPRAALLSHSDSAPSTTRAPANPARLHAGSARTRTSTSRSTGSCRPTPPSSRGR